MDDPSNRSSETRIESDNGMPTRFSFGLFEVDTLTGDLTRSGRRIRLQSQPFRVLVALLEHPGTLVTRQELQSKVWRSDIVVDFEHGIGNAIRKVRDAIGDSADNPRFIETVSGRGYRFIAPVQVSGVEAKQSSVPQEVPAFKNSSGEASDQRLEVIATPLDPEPMNSPSHFRWLPLSVITGLSVVALTCFGVLFAHRSSRWLSLPRITQITLDGSIFPQGFRSPETFSPLAIETGRIFSSSINQGHIVLLETDIDSGQAKQMTLPTEVQEPEVDDISPDGTKLLVRSHFGVELEEAEQPLWVVPTKGGSAYRISEVLSHDATWTPDGRRLVYAVQNRLETIALGGGSSRLLATVAGRPFWLRWSPDGKTLRFTVVDPQTGTASIWELRSDASSATRLSFRDKELDNVCCGTWTADGKFFVIQSRHDGSSDLWALEGNSTTDARQLTNGPLNYTSPSAGTGSEIYFQGADPVAPVEQRAFDPTKSDFLPRTDFLQEAVSITYSLDHRWVAWTDVSGHLWRAHADGSQQLQLTSNSMLVLNCSWSPDDRTLAIMARYPNEGWQVFKINRSGSRPESLLPADERDVGDPSFSPDGRFLAIGGLPILMGGESSNHRPIRIMDLQTRRLEALPHSTDLFSPRWSPDGRYIAALALDQKKLMLYDVRNKSWSVVVTMSISDPLWAPDGKSLYFYAIDSESRPIYQISIPDLTIQKVYRPVCGHHLCILSGIAPENRPLIRINLTRSNIFHMKISAR